MSKLTLLLRTKTPVVTVEEVLSASITFMWKLYLDARGNISDPRKREYYFTNARGICLWLLAVQHSFLHRATEAIKQDAGTFLYSRLPSVDGRRWQEI